MGGRQAHAAHAAALWVFVFVPRWTAAGRCQGVTQTRLQQDKPSAALAAMLLD